MYRDSKNDLPTILYLSNVNIILPLPTALKKYRGNLRGSLIHDVSIISHKYILVISSSFVKLTC